MVILLLLIICRQEGITRKILLSLYYLVCWNAYFAQQEWYCKNNANIWLVVVMFLITCFYSVYYVFYSHGYLIEGFDFINKKVFINAVFLFL